MPVNKFLWFHPQRLLHCLSNRDAAQSRRLKPPSLALLLRWGTITLVVFAVSFASPSWAAERVAVRLGPVKQSVAIADLERFAETGEVTASLQPYALLLNAEVRDALRSRLKIDAGIGNKLVEDLLHSSAGERFLNTLQVALPDATPTQLQIALMHAAQQPTGMSLLSLLKAIPNPTVTVDVASTLALASQLNLPYWQSQALSSILERDLTVKSQPLRPSFDPTQTGSHWVWKQTMVLRDYDRERTIPVDLYWARRTTGPLVVISHGFGADRRFLGYLAYHLASHGLTVVALEHPASNVAWLTGNPLYPNPTQPKNNILPASEFIDRPKDVSFVLDRLSRLNQFSSTLQGKFNTEQVTVMGHSLGGYTALALAGAKLSLGHLRQFCNDPQPVVFSPADLLQCNAADLIDPQESLRDRRVVQTILLNPVMGRLFDAQSLAQVKLPTLMLTGTDDAITPAVSQQFLPFTELRSPKLLLTAIGGTHLSVGDPVNLNHGLTQSIFIRERSEQETEPVRHLLRGVSLAYIKQLTPEANRYKLFLTPAYAQSFSTETLKLRLNSQLPPNFSKRLKIAALPMEQLIARTLAKGKSQTQQGFCYGNSECLLGSLPLVMFILPGGLPVAVTQFFRWRRLAKTRPSQRLK
jgi:predicted dienelactone hydrolase